MSCTFRNSIKNNVSITSENKNELLNEENKKYANECKDLKDEIGELRDRIEFLRNENSILKAENDNLENEKRTDKKIVVLCIIVAILFGKIINIY